MFETPLFHLPVNVQMLQRGKRSRVNSWEGTTVDSLSSSKASSERDITFDSLTGKQCRHHAHLHVVTEKNQIITVISVSTPLSLCCTRRALFLLFMKTN